MNKPVSPKLAELLFNKKYDGDYNHWYNHGKLQHFGHDQCLDIYANESVDRPNAPTIADTVMWIYNKYGIWISVDNDSNKWFEVISILKENNRIIQNSHETISEAYESAIKYVLTKLI